MDYESTVMYYLASKGLFLSPQFSIPSGYDGEWSCPDFVGLDFAKKEINIIEVTTAYNVSGLLQKVNDRDNQWILKLQDYIKKNNIVDNTWSYVVRVFIRKERIEYFKENLKNKSGVILQTLEEIAFPWAWDTWENMDAQQNHKAGSE